jgi:hypothetical protein
MSSGRGAKQKQKNSLVRACACVCLDVMSCVMSCHVMSCAIQAWNDLCHFLPRELYLYSFIFRPHYSPLLVLFRTSCSPQIFEVFIAFVSVCLH